MGQRSTRSLGRGGAASPGGGAQRGGTGGAVFADPPSPLEPSPGESVANTFQPGAHADAGRRGAASGESHFPNPWGSNDWGSQAPCKLILVINNRADAFFSVVLSSFRPAARRSPKGKCSHFRGSGDVCVKICYRGITERGVFCQGGGDRGGRGAT